MEALHQFAKVAQSLQRNIRPLFALTFRFVLLFKVECI